VISDSLYFRGSIWLGNRWEKQNIIIQISICSLQYPDIEISKLDKKMP